MIQNVSERQLLAVTPGAARLERCEVKGEV